MYRPCSPQTQNHLESWGFLRQGASPSADTACLPSLLPQQLQDPIPSCAKHFFSVGFNLSSDWQPACCTTLLLSLFSIGSTFTSCRNFYQSAMVFKVLASSINKPNHPIHKPTGSTFLLATVSYSERVLHLFSRCFSNITLRMLGFFWFFIVEGFLRKPQSINLTASQKSDVKFTGQDALSLQPH